MAGFLQLGNIGRHWRAISVSTALSWLMKAILLGLLPWEVYQGNYLFSAAVALVFLLSLIPSLVQHNYRITLPFELDLLLTSMIFLHTFFGESLDFYEKYWFWDKALHLYGGGVVALLAFVTVYTLHYTRKVRLTIPLIGMFTVIFALAAGAAWEIGEFSVDMLFARNTQKGLENTMFDLINDFIGGVFAAGLGMAYVRYSKPMTRKRLAKPLGEVMGLADRVDRIKQTMKEKKQGEGAE